MRLSLRILGLDLLDLTVTTDDEEPEEDKPEPRDSEVGIAATVHTEPPPERLGFEDKARR